MQIEGGSSMRKSQPGMEKHENNEKTERKARDETSITSFSRNILLSAISSLEKSWISNSMVEGRRLVMALGLVAEGSRCETPATPAVTAAAAPPPG